MKLKILCISQLISFYISAMETPIPVSQEQYLSRKALFPQLPDISMKFDLSYLYTKDESLLAWKYDSSITLFNKNCDEVKSLDGHTDTVTSVAWSPDDTKLASGSCDKTVRIWNISDKNQEPIILEGHNAAIELLSWSPNKNKLASVSADSIIYVWNVEQPHKKPQILNNKASVISLHWSSNEKGLVARSSDSMLRLYDIH